MSERTAALLGTGLIGSSIGVALRAAGYTVVAWDRDPSHLDGASGIGAFDRRASSQSEALAGADLVVLAVPAEATVDILAGLDTDVLVIDVAGVKAPIAAAGAHLPHFVATHPMAGGETSGPEGASGSLFRGATWVIATDHASVEDLDAVTEIVEAFGAVPVRMTAAEHDIAVALASHLPHLMASALVETVAADPDAFAVAGGGFRDLTRIAASKAPWWPDVLVENRLAVVDAIEAVSGRLSAIADELRSGERDAISRRLDATADIRRSMAAPVVGVRLVLEDRPGQMALVGAALSSSSVDLRDLQLRHATHGGGGVLTLSVRPDEAEKLAEALRLQGFTLLD